MADLVLFLSLLALAPITTVYDAAATYSETAGSHSRWTERVSYTAMHVVAQSRCRRS